MTPFTITCPGCGRPLNVPPEAVGRRAHCPHCRTNFRLPANDDGTPGTPERPRPWLAVPRVVAGPAFALLFVGVVGALVNGTLLAHFLARPGADLDYARGQVMLFRNDQEMTRLKQEGKKLDATAPPAEPDPEQAARDEAMARSWGPVMKPVHLTFLLVSLTTLAGAAAMLKGRFYPLALVGCVAAIANVNNLCCVPGGFAGLWGLLVLIRDDGRRHFGR